MINQREELREGGKKREKRDLNSSLPMCVMDEGKGKADMIDTGGPSPLTAGHTFSRLMCEMDTGKREWRGNGEREGTGSDGLGKGW